MQKPGNWEPINSKAIISNINLVFKTNDIYKLNKSTYNFVMNLSGFIAHYNLAGFQCTYEDLRLFATDLIDACTEGTADREANDSDFNKWYGKAYCQSKADAINGIREVVTKFNSGVTTSFENKDAEKLQNLISLATEVQRRNDPDLTRKFLAEL